MQITLSNLRQQDLMQDIIKSPLIKNGPELSIELSQTRIYWIMLVLSGQISTDMVKILRS